LKPATPVRRARWRQRERRARRKPRLLTRRGPPRRTSQPRRVPTTTRRSCRRYGIPGPLGGPRRRQHCQPLGLLACRPYVASNRAADFAQEPPQGVQGALEGLVGPDAGDDQEGPQRASTRPRRGVVRPSVMSAVQATKPVVAGPNQRRTILIMVTWGSRSPLLATPEGAPRTPPDRFPAAERPPPTLFGQRYR